MNLAIDIGNTFVKMAVMDDGQIVDTYRTGEDEKAAVEHMLAEYPAIERAIVVSGRGPNGELDALLAGRMKQYIRFDHTVPIPVKNLYATPETLGCDRLAAAVGAASIYPSHKVLIVDFGTAITFDVVSKSGEFLGGNISPGAYTRLRSLHDYTNSLPMCSLPDRAALIGNDTRSAIENGVVVGITLEVEGYISAVERENEEFKIIFTGGDANYFAKQVKNTIFVTSDLIFYGLNAILDYNAN